MVDSEQLPTDTETDVNSINIVPNKSASPRGLIESIISKWKVLIAIGLVLVILSASFYVLWSNQRGSLENIINKAESQYQSGNYDESVRILEDALRTNKDNPKLLAAVIRTISSKGNQTGAERETFSQAKPYVDRALTVTPNDFGVLRSVGYAYETTGEYNKALDYYSRALEINPNSAPALFSHAHILEFLGRRKEAYAEYERAYNLDKNNPQILMARGNMFLSQGKAQESFESFKMASEIPGISNQIKSEALTAASLVRGSQDNFKYIKEATELSKKAVDAGPNFSPALAAHGYNLFLTAPNINEGVEYVKRAIQANPRISKNYFLLATFYRASRSYTDSINYLREAIARIDNDNTLLGNETRLTTKGTYTYELAKTYVMASSSTDVRSLLKDAFKYNSALGPRIREDIVRYDLFKNLQSDKEFLDLIKI